MPETMAENRNTTGISTLLHHGFAFTDPKMKLIVFTEHKDTLDYLVKKLEEWGLIVTQIHGGMKIGAGVVAAVNLGAKELVDPRPYLVGTLKQTFESYPDIGTLLPAGPFKAALCRNDFEIR